MIPLIRAIAILLIMTPALAVAGPPKNYERLDSETSLPSDSFTNGLGVEMQLGDFHGKVVLLNLWATWCGPCVREMPHLDKLQAMLGGADFEVVALSSDRGGVEKVEPFFRRTNVNHLEIYLDPKNRIARALGARGLPTTYSDNWLTFRLIRRLAERHYLPASGTGTGRVNGGASPHPKPLSFIPKPVQDEGKAEK